MKVTEARYHPHYTVSWAQTPNKTLAADAAFDYLDEAVSVRFFHSGVLFYFISFLYAALWKTVTISSTHLRSWGYVPPIWV
jgi:hypothetical protein